MTKFGDSLECFTAIAKWLTEAVPEPWEQITVDFEIIEIDDVSEDVIVYTPLDSPRVEKQFFIEDTNFTDCFFQLAHLTSTPEKGFFKKCKFTLFKNGKYKTDFQY